MYENWEQSHNMSTRAPFEKPFINAPRNPLNFWRRPSFSFPRRRTMAGRYPNMSFRNYVPTVYRSDYPMPRGTSPDLIYSKPKPPIRVASPFVQRPPLFYMPCNTLGNKNNQYILPATNFNDSQVAIEPDDKKNELSELTTFSDLWVESLAPGGRIYYYNTRTRESTWIKPINVRIIELNEIKQLTVRPELENSEKMHKENSDQNLQLINSSNTYPNNYSMPPNFIMFPPNVLIPPPNFLMPPAENIQKNIANYNIRFMIPPPLLPFPVIAENLISNNIMTECNLKVPQNVLPSNSVIEYNSNSTQNLLLRNEANLITNTQNMLSNDDIIHHNKSEIQNCLSSDKSDNHSLTIKQNIFPKNKFIDYASSDSEGNSNSKAENGTKTIESAVRENEETDMNNTKSSMTPHSSSPTEVDIVKDASEKPVQDRNEESVNLNSKNNLTPNIKSEDSVTPETKYISCINLNKEKPINKSRPVSSTPIPGTNWCVVWTGDKRVFFYDSQRKVSVWERPTELLNRSNVDKLVEKSPLSLDLTPLTKESRKNLCDHSDVIKKQRKDGERSENSQVKKTDESTKVENIVVENTSEIEEKPNCNNYSHEQSIEMFREMLSDNEITISSTWEKEVQKIIFDSRYLLLHVEERKQVFNDYVKNKLESPTDLLNSGDTDTIVNKSTLSLDLKPLVKEGRKHSSVHSDVTKKHRKDAEKGENSKVKKEDESTNVENIFINENTLAIEEKPKYDNYSHEQRIEMFCEMLSDNEISIFSTWEKEVQKIVFDSRYLLLPVEERRQVFNDYIERKLQEDAIKHQKEHQQKESFLSLLEEAGVTSKSLFCDIVLRYSEDTRFKDIEEIELKESIFNQYTSELEKKEKEKYENELKRDFIELLSENNCFDKEWPEVQNMLADDKRYEAIQSSFLKENLFKEYIRENCLNTLLSEKPKSTSTNIINSEKKINPDLSTHHKNQMKGVENHEHTLAVSHFKALLEDLIEDSELNWQSAKVILKVDKRWNYSQNLGPEKCEELFYEYINAKKKDQFRCLLEELPDLTMKTSWLDIRKDVLKDPRCAKFSSCERKCEKEFKEYLNSKRSRAKFEFKQLLKETKLITSKSKSLFNCSDYLNDIEKTLSQDKRYSNLDCIRSTRKHMLLSYFNKLKKAKGLTTNEPPIKHLHSKE